MLDKVVSLINLKGGVAKTTTTVQLAECLASQFSKNVLVIDLDPQTNATIALIGEDKWDELDRKKQTVFQMFKDKLDDTSHFQIQPAIQEGVSNLKLNTLSLLPSSIQLLDIQDRLHEISTKTEGTIAIAEVLKHSIKPYLNRYDYVFIELKQMNKLFLKKTKKELDKRGREQMIQDLIKYAETELNRGAKFLEDR